MLKPAQLYKEELNNKMISTWYTDDATYYSGWYGDSTVRIPDDNSRSHNFVSVSNDQVVGYICYEVDYTVMTARNFGLISFDKGNQVLVRDLYDAINDIFYKYNMNRLEFCCIADNPIIHSYRSFIKLHGGKECAYYRQCTKLKDGKLHDSVSFEILKSEYNKKGSYEL